MANFIFDHPPLLALEITHRLTYKPLSVRVQSPFDWLMHWLSKQPAWGRSREFEITTRTAGREGMLASTNHEDIIEDEEESEEDDDELVHGRRKKKVAFLPSMGQCLCSTRVSCLRIP